MLQSLRIRNLALLDEVRKALPGQVVRGSTEQHSCAVVDALDELGLRFEHEDGLGHGVQDLPEPVGRLEGARVLDGRAGPRREIDGEGDMPRLEGPTALRAGEAESLAHHG